MKRKSRILVGLVVISILVYLYILFAHDDVAPQTRSNMADMSIGSDGRPSSPNQERVLSMADRYCNSPKLPTHGSEGQVPDGFDLEQVQLLIRHGDRSPMHAVKEQPEYRLNCSMELAGALSPKARRYLSHLRRYGRDRPRSGFRQVSIYPKRRYCDQAQLTPIGVEQHLKLGRHLRKVYIDKHKLLKHELDTSEIYLKSTKYSRTYQSASAFLFGFLPNYKVSELRFNEAPISFCSSEIHSCNCPLYSSQVMKVNDRLVAIYSKELKAYFDVNVGRIFPSLRVTGFRGTVDALMGPYCNSVPICHNCNQTRVLESIWHVENTVRNKLKDDPTIQRLQRLYMHPFLFDIATRMRDRSLGRSDQRFVLNSGHDVTVSAMMVALGVRDHHWPPYASRLAFELYRHEREYFVRLLFNGNDVTDEVRFCRTIRKGQLCPLKHFWEFVNKDNFLDFGARTYEEACREDVDICERQVDSNEKISPICL